MKKMKKIVSLLIMVLMCVGAKAQENDVKPEWYHKPSDEYRDDWDLSGTLANTNLMFSVAISLANAKP